jgi:hypothetical protein
MLAESFGRCEAFAKGPIAGIVRFIRGRDREVVGIGTSL